MFNIQPGTGLGFSASKEIALGLGYAVLITPPEQPIVLWDKVKGGWVTPDDENYFILAEEYQRQAVLKDDEEVLGIIIQILTSGIL